MSDSPNHQIIMCGTPPTAISTGTVFLKYRNKTLKGENKRAYWAEWSVPFMSDCNDHELWYDTNPALGFQLSEEDVEDEIGDDEIDFNIQRLGLWLQYNQKSVFNEKEWDSMTISEIPRFIGKLFIGVKYGKDDENVAVSLAVKTQEQKIYVECIDCRPIREGNQWIVELLSRLDYDKVIIDGANHQSLLERDLRDNGLKRTIKPSVATIIEGNSSFANAIYQKTLLHNRQPSVRQVVTNCSKRAIGSNGGFGFKSEKEGADIVLMDSIMLAHWLCSTTKEKKKIKVSY